MTQSLINILEMTGIILASGVLFLKDDIRKMFRGIGHINGKFVKYLQYKAAIQSELDMVLGKLQASRVSILQYSNGNYTLSGIPFKYSSMTFESVDTINKKILPELQFTAIDPYITILLAIEKSPAGYIQIGSGNPDINPELLSNPYGITKSYYFKIGNDLSNGILCIDYTYDNPDELDDRDIFYIKAVISRIFVLMNSVKQTK